MNKELYQKIKQTIMDKNCLYQIDIDKQTSIIHNISAYVAEMLENKESVETILYSYDEFVTLSTQTLCKEFVKQYNETNYVSIEIYFYKFQEFYSKLLTKELNKK
jgi:hypothetical protein